MTNQFTVLEIEEGENEDQKQLALVEDNTNQSPAISPNAARNNNAQMPNRLNPKAKAFIPNDKGIECEGQL